jgi:ribose 5-phosphate isomerase B
MIIALGSDHAGFPLKETIKSHLAGKGHELRDFGAASADPADYPDYAKKVAASVASRACERGVLICGSGIGMCMAANRFKGVRAAVLHDGFDAEMSRRHNDANIACLGARRIGEDEAIGLVDKFLSTPFEGGRHEKRVAKIDS